MSHWRRTIVLAAILVLTRMVALAARSASLTDVHNLPGLTDGELLAKGDYYANKKQEMDSAYVCYTLVANRYHDKKANGDNTRNCILAQRSIGLIYLFDYYDFPNAYLSFLKAKECAEADGHRDLLPDILLNIAVIEGEQTMLMYNHSHTYNKEVFMLFKQAFQAARQQRQYATMVLCMLDLLSMTTSGDHLNLIGEEMRAVMHDIPDSIKPLAYTRQAIMGLRAMGTDHDKAIGCFNEALRLARRDADPYELPSIECMLHNYLYECFLRKGDLPTAKSYLLANLKIESDNNILIERSATYGRLYDFYTTHQPDSTMATHYRLLQLESNYDIVNKSMLASLDKTKFRHELLNMQEEMRAVQQKKEARSIIIILMSVMLAVIALFSWKLYTKYRQLARSNHQLYLNTQDLIAESDQMKLLIRQMKTDHTAEPPEEGEGKAGGGPTEATYKNIKMEQHDIDHLLVKILSVMETSDAIFSEQFSQETLCQLTNSNRVHLSYVLKQNGTSFYTLLGKYRIQEACRRMNDHERYGHLTIEAIGHSVGYKSNSSFIAAFKRYTGLKPSEYLLARKM